MHRKESIAKKLHAFFHGFSIHSIIKKSGKPFIPLPSIQRRSVTRQCLCAVAIMWNEGKDLREWIEFHRIVGFEHIYLYDDGSTDNSAETVRPYIANNYVTLIPWAPFFKGYAQQRLAYAHALATFGSNWRWMAFIDLDEFLFPVKDNNIRDSLQRYEDLPAIVVPWHVYGFSGHEKRPDGLVIENFTQRIPFPPPEKPSGLLNWKSIVNPHEVMAVDSVHFFNLRNGKRGGFNESRHWISNKRPFNWQKVQSEVFRLNHYFTKSREEFIEKRSHGRSATGRNAERQIRRVMGYANAIDSLPPIEDRLIFRFLSDLRERVFPNSNSD